MDTRVRQEIREFQTNNDADEDNRVFTQIARLCTPMLLALDVVAWIALVTMSLVGPSDPAAKSLGVPLAWLITGLFVATVLPAFVLVVLRRFQRVAMILTIAFPVAFILAYVAMTIVL